MERFSTKLNSCIGIFLALVIFAENTHAKDCDTASIEPKCEFSPSLTINFPSPRSTIHFFLADQAGPAEISVLIKTPGGKKLLLDSIGAEGGEIPKIESTFLADANKDGKNDLLILASWNINHPGLKTTGTYFRTFVYGYDDIKGGLYRIECAEKIIGSGIVGTVEGEKENYPYTNAGRIRKLLQHSQCSLKSTANSQD